MKSQKTNAFQLTVAGAVLVLVLICGTFAWFAVGDSAFISKIMASLSSPEIPTQINSIEYSAIGGENADDWKTYNGESLKIEPGKTWHFRVKFTALPTKTVQMNLVNIDGFYRQPVDTDVPQGEEESTVEVTTLPATDTAALLSRVLEYRVNSADGEFSRLTLQADNRTAVLLPSALVDSEQFSGSQYVYYYDLKMSDEADNSYMDSEISFDLQLIFGQTVES